MASDKDLDRRTETAKRHDDSHLVPDEEAPDQGGRAGGNLERDIGTEDAMRRAQKGEDAGVTRVRKEDEIDHGTG